MDNLKNCFLAVALAGVLFLGTAQMSFGQNVITNGDFESFTPANGTSPGAGLDSASNPTYAGGVTLTDWTSQGYNFVFTNGNAGDVAATGSDGALSLWGPNNPTPTLNGLTLPPQPPGGANVVANDGAYEVGPLSQTINGLTSGKTYAVSFEWAGAQQSGFNGATTESWTVSLGAAGLTGGASASLAGAQTTVPANNATHGFTGWMSQTFDFTAGSSTETLYFLANGTPTGEPPFSLLSDVSMTPVPEPAATAGWTILFAMLIMAGNRAWRLYQKRSSTNA